MHFFRTKFWSGIVFASIHFGHIDAAQHQECNATSALLKVVKNSIGVDGEMDPALHLRPAVMGNVTFSNYTKFNSGSFDYEVCLPRAGLCYELRLDDVSRSSRPEISWDGERVETGDIVYRTFKTMSFYTEIGDTCIPECNAETEALVEHTYWGGWFGEDSFRLEDLNGNEVFGRSCLRYEPVSTCYKILRLLNYRTCLPRDTCYRFVIGDSYWYPYHDGSEEHDGQFPSFSLRYDGDLVAAQRAVSMLSVHLGGDACTNICDPGQILVELILDRGQFLPYPPISWELLLHKTEGAGKSFDIILDGTITQEDKRLFYESICTPKDSCLSFSMSAPAFRRAADARFVGRHLLKMDGVPYSFQSNPFYDRKAFTINMGKCSVENLCNSTTHDLFQLDFHTSTAVHEAPVIFLNWELRSSSMIYKSQDNYYTMFELDTSYRVMECVSNEECDLVFGITNEGCDSISIQKNGKLQMTVTEREFYSPSFFDAYKFGSSCERGGLGAGAIAGIAIGSIAAAALLLRLYCW